MPFFIVMLRKMKMNDFKNSLLTYKWERSEYSVIIRALVFLVKSYWLEYFGNRNYCVKKMEILVRF